MSIKTIETKDAMKPMGPYSQAKVVNNLIFTSGQIPMNSSGELINGAIEVQTRVVINNIKAILEASGSSLDKVIKTTVYLSDINDFQRMNSVYEKFFTSKPARSTIQAARLPKDVKIEIDAIALK